MRTTVMDWPNKTMVQQILAQLPWAAKLDGFLQFNERDLLDNPGQVSAAIAQGFAESEFDKFRVRQDQVYESDFDRAVKRLIKEKP